jgi:hypothetical protein
MPLPKLLYAQVVKKMSQRHIVSVKHLVVIGTQAAVDQVLSACGWVITQNRHPNGRNHIKSNPKEANAR